MITAKVYFEDGNTLTTQMNATPEQIEKYYLGKRFQFGDTEEHPKDKMAKAVKVEILQPFIFEFKGREATAIGATYEIKTEIHAFNKHEAFEELYTKFEHIGGLTMNGEVLSY